jgi:hypothetical protein
MISRDLPRAVQPKTKGADPPAVAPMGGLFQAIPK